MATPTDRRLEDLEEDALVAVEAERERRARGLRPWSITEYLDRIAAVHARFEAARRARLGAVAS